MADPLLGEMTGFIKRLLRKLPLAKFYPGEVKSQDAALRVDIAPDDVADLPATGLSGIKLALGLPGFKVKVPAATRLRLWWDSWDSSRPIAGLFDSGSPVTEIAFDNGTKAVARVDDTVDCGTLSGTAPGGGGPVTFTYTPPGGAPVVSTTVSLSGKITSGNTKFKA